MHPKLLSLLIATAIASPAFAGSVTGADVGRFIRDPSGAPVGSLVAIHGDKAVVWYGFAYTPGNHLETVPLSAITVAGGRLVLNDGSASHVAAR